MTPSRVTAVLIVSALLSIGPTPRVAFCASIDVVGVAGLPGVAGVSAPPFATDGSPGGDGGGAVALADALEPSNQATATGGAGGVGGAGGSGPVGTLLGDGGAGGEGGAASATATTLGPAAEATAIATGGDGAFGGGGGAPTGLGSGGTGGAGGVGGDAAALASADSSSGGAVADSSAVGGAGGSGGFDGDRPEQNPPPSGPSGDGGNAYGEASASGVGNDSVVARAFITGGRGGGGPIAGDGGAAELGPVVAISSGGGSIQVFSSVAGGNGGLGFPSGVNGAGADAAIDNAVSASTTGAMFLTQGAAGGDAHGGRLGEGVLAGSGTNRWVRQFSASSLEGVMEARGGDGFVRRSTNPVAAFGHGGSAALLGDISNEAGSLFLQARSFGGIAGGLGDGGDATSDVSARTTGDAQRIELLTNTGGGDAGASVSGNLEHGYCWGDGTQCRGGDARSVVHAEALGRSDVLVIDSVFGGAGGSAAPGDPTRVSGGAGGSATGESTARGGGLIATITSVRATGGDGGDGSNGFGGGSGGRGGDASYETTSEVVSDSIGRAIALSFGGHGGAGYGRTVGDARSGDGGSARAESLSLGTGQIEARSEAIAGLAGEALNGAVGGVDGSGVALASAFGAAGVRADALASGGASSRASAAASSTGSPISAHAQIEALSGPYANLLASGATAVQANEVDPVLFDEQGVVVLIHADPAAERAAEWLLGTSLDTAYLAGEIDVLALGSAFDREDALGGRSIRSTQSFSLDTTGLAPGTGVYLSFLELIGPAIDVLDVQLEADGTVLADFHFEESLAGAEALLDPIHVLDASLGSGIVTIDLELEFTVSTSAVFSSKFALYADTEAVPEARPVGMLVLLAVLVLTARSALPTRFAG